MESIDYNGISRLISCDTVNFIAFVMTPWHLIGAKAAIKYVEQDGKEVRPVIVSLPHPQTGYAITKDDEYKIYYLRESRPVFNPFKYLSFLIWCWRSASKQDDVTLYFVNPWYGKFKIIYSILLDSRPCFKIIIFEEGIGAYVKEHYSLGHYLKTRNLLQFLQVGVDLFLSKRFYIKRQIINLNPFCYGDNGRLYFNENAINMYKKALKIQPAQLNMKKVVILTQEVDDEIIRVVNLISQVLSSNDFDVYIKAHPRFPIDSRSIMCGVTIVEHAVAIESLLSTINTKYVISFNTTALLSLRYLYDATTISLIHLVQEDCCQGLFSWHGSFNTWFEQTFSDMVLFPKDLNAFQELFGLSGSHDSQT